MSLLNNKQIITVLVIGAAGAYILSQKASKAAQAINPVNDENIFNQGAIGLGEAITGDPNATSSLFSHIYGGLDLLNPFAPDYRKEYARQVWGFE